MSRTTAITPAQFTTFGELLRFLRHRAGLTQRELSIVVNYSEGQISRMEKNERAPDAAVLAARFVPALELEQEPEWIARLLELAVASRVQLEAGGKARASVETANNLPIQLTGFVGREREIAEMRRLLSPDETAKPEVRLLTLTGVGGSGKTRLAVRTATELLGEFSDGVYFVNLAPLTEAILVLPTVAQTLGINALPNETALEAIQEHLRAKQLLLVLDNFEQVLDAAPMLVGLLTKALSIKILVTSRSVLHLSFEREFPVPPLSVPRLGIPFEELMRNEAIALFVQRAQVVRPQFQLSETNVRAVAEICVRLDGLPLAIELAAARTQVLSPAELLARLSSRLGLLTGGARDLPARQQTLRNTIDWSYHLLEAEEQTLFARLGVFAAGWMLDAAERVCNALGDLPGDMVHGLGALLDHNLIQQTISINGSARFTILETLREYALEKLEASGELQMLRQHHANYYFAFVDEGLYADGRPHKEGFFEHVLEENDNLRAAFAWSQGTRGNVQMGMRLAEAAEYFLNNSEYQGWLERVLASAEAEGGYDPHTRARLLWQLGYVKGFQGDYAGAETSYLESLGVFRGLGDKEWTAVILDRLGWAARERGETSKARVWLEEALELARGLNKNGMLYVATNTLAETMTMQGETDASRRLLEEILPAERQSGDKWCLGWTLNHLGHIAQIEGAFEQATRLHLESVSLFREFKRPFGIAESLHALGETVLVRGDTSHAASHLHESLAISQKAFLRSYIAWCLASLAGVAVLNEQPERAAFLWGAAEALRVRIGAREGPATHATHERLKARAREQLGEEAFATAWARGANADIDKIVAEVLAAAS